MEQKDMRKQVMRIVRRLGFVHSYLGTGYLIEAVLLCLEEPDALTAVTKWVYPGVATRKGTKWRNVERDLRTAMEAFWERGNLELLNELAGFELRTRPSVGEVINYIVGYLQEQQ